MSLPITDELSLVRNDAIELDLGQHPAVIFDVVFFVFRVDVFGYVEVLAQGLIGCDDDVFGLDFFDSLEKDPT